jgi:two-component system sensor histidine kinase MprB
VTFRARLVLATAVAVSIAVLLACGSAWLFARNALVSSADDTLQQAALSAANRPSIEAQDNAGAALQVVGFDGSVVLAAPGGQIPVDATVKRVAARQATATFETIEIGELTYRQLIIPLSAGEVIGPRSDFQILTRSGALQLVVPLAGVNKQLHRLGSTLLFVAGGGIVIAILLGLLVARTAIRPLDEVAEAVEELAETTDMTRRLDERGSDELGRLRRAFNQLFGALERSQDQQRQLVLDASHELRTPLTSLRTNTEVLRRVDELDPTTREQLLDDVLTQLGELTTLVGDLAELARGEHHVEAPSRFRLDQLVDDLVTVAATHGRTRDVEISLDASECWVHGHRERLSRAIGNLIDNALKWSPEGAIVEVSVAGGVVTVRDHGPGIADEDLSKIFDRFYRSPAARALPGSGLGLAIVAQVVAEESGTIAASAAPGGGALLRLAIPTVS